MMNWAGGFYFQHELTHECHEIWLPLFNRNSHTPVLIGLRNKMATHPSPERFRLSSSALQLMVEKKG